MKRMSRASLGLLAAAVICAAGRSPLQQAPPECARKVNPFEGDPQAERAGAKLYARECAACHGANREGIGKEPALNRADVSHSAPGALFWVLRNGSLQRGMPSFAHLPDPQRWQIVTFLRGPGNLPQ
jgi:mono/diheme cytochrome c family protein